MNRPLRFEWIDIVKAFAIILVVLGHINYAYPIYRLIPVPYIYSWHIRVFFLVGGFFLFEDKLMKPYSFIKNKAKRLYLPLLYIYIPATLLHNILIDIGVYDLTIKYGGSCVMRLEGLNFFFQIVKTILFAGHEPIVGAMWFVYVLFLALIWISISYYIASKITNKSVDSTRRTASIIILAGAIASSFMINIWGIEIPRVSQTLQAAWLIFVGMVVMQQIRLTFDNRFVFILCAIGLYSIAVLRSLVHMDGNETEIISLTISSVFALYVFSYIAKKCRGMLGMVLSFIGRESFYIMAFHFIAFKICSLLLNMIGYSMNIAQLSATSSNLFILIFYLVGGVFIPIGIICVWRKLKIGLLYVIRYKK